MDVALQTIERTPRTLKRTLTAYVSLTKPRVVELLLVVTAPTMLLAERNDQGTRPRCEIDPVHEHGRKADHDK
jgi:heme O synthase-like polyprenyltransferase